MSPKKVRVNAVVGRIVLLAVGAFIALLIGEVGARLLSPSPQFSNTSSEDQFWTTDEELGWARTPSVTDHYSNGYFRGQVSIDGRGNRRNGEDTTVTGARNILFIGDSTTASLEVDDHQTVPALLEAKYRDAGFIVNVINLGVRGYGTDQSVRNAIRQSGHFQPSEIIYMFSSNDIFDNQALRQPGRRYGKGAYVLRGDQLTNHNIPVRQFARQEIAAVLVNPEGIPQPTYREFSPLPNVGWAWIEKFANRSRLVFQALRLKRRSFPVGSIEVTAKALKDGKTDPWLVRDRPNGDMILALLFGLDDGGALRRLHSDYYDRHFEALLALLRTIPSVEKIHLIEFPSPVTLDLLKDNETSDNYSLFSELMNKGTIDTYLGLSREVLSDGLTLKELQCPMDGHFCASGNVWVADKIMDALPNPLTSVIEDPD